MFIEESTIGAENLKRALRACDSQTDLLYLTSDMPYITADALRAFVDAAPANALALALTPFDVFAARFPGAPAFGVTLAGEKVANGGAFVIPAAAAPRIETFAVKLFD